MQNEFIFFDTETFITKQIFDKEDNLLEEIQELKLGWGLYWNRLTNEKEYFYFEDYKEFWDWIEEKNTDELIIYAHNTDFDFKICNGWKELVIKRKYDITKIYIEGPIFMLELEQAENWEAYNEGTNKNTFKLKIYDTFNYVHASLEDIGKALKLPKMSIDFQKCSKEELKVYCRNDVEITFQFIRNLIDFLNIYDLSKLNATGASIALNTFKHKFYDDKKIPIYIHANKFAIKLERDSYRGGITDCFKTGEIREPQIKLDINSMYPHQMRLYNIPTRLFFYGEDGAFLLPEIKKQLNGPNHIIADVTIKLPQEKAYILSRFEINKQEKTGFLYGEYRIVLTTPELEYVNKYGKILKVHRLALYESHNLFKEYVDFFYKKRLEFEAQDNKIYAMFCKSMLNNLYGKFAQKESDMTLLKKDNLEIIRQYRVIDGTQKKNNNYSVLRIGGNLIKITPTDKNSYDSFVAISSIITAYARMYLIEIIEKAKRENIAYCDTDSIIINKSAIDSIKKYIDYNKTRALGLLKIEGESKLTKIIRPKYYEFDGDLKCKGVKTKGKNKAITLEENDNFWRIKQIHFEKFKTSLRKNHATQQHLKMIEKKINKRYDKGFSHQGIVTPYHISDVKLLPN